jgi:hypothetical protein
MPTAMALADATRESLTRSPAANPHRLGVWFLPDEDPLPRL